MQDSEMTNHRKQKLLLGTGYREPPIQTRKRLCARSGAFHSKFNAFILTPPFFRIEVARTANVASRYRKCHRFGAILVQRVQDANCGNNFYIYPAAESKSETHRTVRNFRMLYFVGASTTPKRRAHKNRPLSWSGP